MKSIYLIIIGSLIILGCERRACQSPPPNYNFAFITSQQEPVVQDSIQAASLRLVYNSPTGTKMIVPATDFKPYPSTGPSKYTYRMDYNLIAQNHPPEYTIEVGGQAVGKLSLTAQINNNRCDGWMHLTDVRSNNKPVSIDSYTSTYTINVGL